MRGVQCISVAAVLLFAGCTSNAPVAPTSAVPSDGPAGPADTIPTPPTDLDMQAPPPSGDTPTGPTPGGSPVPNSTVTPAPSKTPQSTDDRDPTTPRTPPGTTDAQPATNTSAPSSSPAPPPPSSTGAPRAGAPAQASPADVRLSLGPDASSTRFASVRIASDERSFNASVWVVPESTLRADALVRIENVGGSPARITLSSLGGADQAFVEAKLLVGAAWVDLRAGGGVDATVAAGGVLDIGILLTVGSTTPGGKLALPPIRLDVVPA